MNTTVFYANPNTGGVVATVGASSGSTTTIVVSVPSTIAAGTYNVYVETTDGTGNGLVSTASNTVSLSVD